MGITSYFFLPVFYRLQVTSVYEYLGVRFDNKVRILGSLLYAIYMILFLPIVIYIPALALGQVTNLNVHLITPMVCVVCIFYTTLGGLKAVVWTDAIQFGVMLGSMIVVIGVGLWNESGFQNVIQNASTGGRLDISTLSAVLNCLAATIYEDFISPFIRKDTSKEQIGVYLKVIVLVIGVISTALVYVVEKLGGLAPLTLAFAGVTSGPILGLFLMGMVLPQITSKEEDCFSYILEENSYTSRQVRDAAVQTDTRLTWCTQTQTGYDIASHSPTILKLKKQLDEKNERIRELQNQAKLFVSEKKTMSIEDFKEACKHYLPESLSKTVNMVAELKARKPAGNRYTLEFKQHALSLYYSSPRTYKQLVQKYHFPSLDTLRRMTRNIKQAPGLNEFIFRSLQVKLKSRCQKDKVCILTMNEMSLKANLQYDLMKDEIVGFHDIGKGKVLLPARNVLVLMARGVNDKWKQPLEYYFVHSTCKAEDLKQIIINCIEKMLSTGLDVRAVVSDMGTNFKQVSKMFGINKHNSSFQVNGKNIYYIFDTPHLLKNIRSTLMKYSVVFEAMSTYMANGELEGQAIGTVNMLEKFDQLFDILNASTSTTTNQYKKPYRGTQKQESFLKEMLTNLNSMRVYKDTPAENFFGKIRQQGGNSVNPTPKQFTAAFKKLSCGDLLVCPENFNCAEDGDILLMDKEFHDIPTCTKEIPITPTQTFKITNVDFRRNDLPTKNMEHYIAGYLIKKCLLKHVCNECESFSKATTNLSSSVLFCHFKGDTDKYGESSGAFGKLKMPDISFLDYVSDMEKALMKNVQSVIKGKVSQGLYKELKTIEFIHPCREFPKEYMLRLFIRMRIYYIVKYMNRRLNVGNTLKDKVYEWQKYLLIQLKQFSVTSLNVHLITPIVCCVCVFYTTLGGMKAVVWTDAIQFGVMLGSMLVVIGIGLWKGGGLQTVLENSSQGGRLDISLDFDFFKRNTFWAMIVGQAFHQMSYFSVSQGPVQKFMSLPSFKMVKITLILATIGISIIVCLSVLSGLLMYSYYKDCDPLKAKIIKTNDQILPLYVMEQVSFIPGLCGLFISGIFSAGLSTLSAILNCLAATLYEDFISPFIRKDTSQERISQYLKLIVVILGITSIALVYVVEKLGGLVALTLSLAGVTTGPILGLFSLGILLPQVTAKGALTGGIVSLGLMAWVTVTSQWYKAKGILVDPSLSVSTNGCNYPINNTFATIIEMPVIEEPLAIYKVSFYWYAAMGLVVCIIVALTVSCFTKEEKPLNRDCISPVMQFLIIDNELPRYEEVAALKKFKTTVL
ncbi:sodium-coupled monocarboxylate transporter [Holotrichia oblita]|uniref:Sodium-coupled monocarboxylate transporter n=1 Tax=Holotrichia oblita TaxID=644536 RepID=A0ACB9TT98_HOLOL|nr:sodium-coupled monocarboxylate transporter [Holotrichia oblita]